MTRKLPSHTIAAAAGLAALVLCASVAHAGVVSGTIDGLIKTGGTTNVDQQGYFGQAGASLLGDTVHIAFQYAAPFSEGQAFATYGIGTSSVTVAITVNGVTVTNTGTSGLVETTSPLGVQINSGLFDVAFSTTAPFIYGSLQSQAGMNAYLAGAAGLGQVFLQNDGYVNFTITGTSQSAPEPATVGLLGLAAATTVLLRRRRSTAA